MKLKQIAKAFIPPVLVLVIHLVAIATLNVYMFYPWFDIPMHFLGGLAVALTYATIMKQLQKEKYIGKIPPLAFFIFLISLVALTAVLWEFLEFITDQTIAINYQLGLKDTMGDLFLGLIGGIAGYFIKR